MPRISDDERPRFELGPATPFSYRCNACSRCCHHKIIQVSPYEIVRLARNLGLTTTDFIARHTTEGGTVLKRVPEDDAACVFLRSDGCGVHPDRPLVCRIYPLGIEVSPDGTLAFAQIEPHPASEGAYGADGTIAGYAAQQSVPEMRAAIAPYKRLYERMEEILGALDGASQDEVAALTDALLHMADGEAASPLIDADGMLADYCARHGLPMPWSVEETVALHVKAIDEMLDAIAAESLGAVGAGAP